MNQTIPPQCLDADMDERVETLAGAKAKVLP